MSGRQGWIKFIDSTLFKKCGLCYAGIKFIAVYFNSLLSLTQVKPLKLKIIVLNQLAVSTVKNSLIVCMALLVYKRPAMDEWPLKQNMIIYG